MIIEAEAKVELDKYELESTQALLRKFIEQKHIVTSVELVSMDEHVRSWDGVMLGVERVGMRVKIVAYGKLGAIAIAELLESLGARSDALGGDVIGLDDSACEPSASDRLFYKPQTIVLPNGEVRRFSPPNPPFEPCPAADDRGYGGMIIKATHPKRPSGPAREVSRNHIGERIRAFRRAAGLTLEDTAKAMGTSIPYASSVERCDIIPTPDHVEELATSFGIDVATLRSNDQSPQNPVDDQD